MIFIYFYIKEQINKLRKREIEIKIYISFSSNN